MAPPRSGKDALAALFESHMGKIDAGGFGGGLMPEQVQIPLRAGVATRSANGPTPFTDALRGARSIVVPELKQHEALDMEMLKSLVEQEGALITSRRCRGNTIRWRPSALIATLGNYCPNFGNPPPDGTERRVNVLTMTHSFAKKSDPEMMIHQGDFSLKAKINKGLVWNDLFHVAKAFYGFLEHYGDKIRRPRTVEQDTLEALQPEGGMTTTADGERKARQWYHELFQPADGSRNSINKSQACQAAMKHLGLARFSDAKSELTKLGFNLDARVNGKRFVTFKFQDHAVAVALKLEGAPGAAASSGS